MKTLTCLAAASLVSSFALGCASKATDTSSSMPLKSLSKNDPVYGYVEAMRKDLSRGKVEIITDVMRLNSEESKVFWPIYQDYESELFDLGDKRLELIRQFGADYQAHSLDDTKAITLADGFFQFEAAQLDLLKKYHAIIAKELSPLHAAQFLQIEHRVGTVTDLLIASEVPLIDNKSGRGE